MAKADRYLKMEVLWAGFGKMGFCVVKKQIS